MPTDDLLIAERARAALDEALARGAATGGWLLSGPKGIGKRTVADAFVAAHLSGADRLDAADPNVASKVRGGGHPDQQVLARTLNEKTNKRFAAIRTDDVRDVTERLFRTAGSGRRAVIVDTADELNPNSANALLKSLEEPPAGTLFVLLSKAVGALLTTIRSRCRVVALPPLPEDALVPWLARRAGAGEAEARAAAFAAGGAPGRALSMLEEPAAGALADDFLRAAANGGDLLAVAEAAGAKANEAAWPEAWTIITERIGRALRGQADDAALRGRAGPALLSALDEARTLAQRADGLNADRTHTALVLGRTIQRGLRAGR